MGEVKVYSANELTEIVQNAENSAISLYVSELQKTKLAEDPSTVKRNLVQTGNKEGRQEAHTSILNYQDKRRMRVESKVYLKQINSDAIYSDNHGPKTNVVHIDNKERSQQAHTSILILFILTFVVLKQMRYISITKKEVNRLIPQY